MSGALAGVVDNSVRRGMVLCTIRLGLNYVAAQPNWRLQFSIGYFLGVSNSGGLPLYSVCLGTRSARTLSARVVDSWVDLICLFIS